jgi:hypothetical protein
VGFGQAAVAGVVYAGDGDGLADGALDARTQGVFVLPVSGFLLVTGLS